jgi:hypothetical protein
MLLVNITQQFRVKTFPGISKRGLYIKQKSYLLKFSKILRLDKYGVTTSVEEYYIIQNRKKNTRNLQTQKTRVFIGEQITISTPEGENQ